MDWLENMEVASPLIDGLVELIPWATVADTNPSNPREQPVPAKYILTIQQSEVIASSSVIVHSLPPASSGSFSASPVTRATRFSLHLPWSC